MKTKLILLCCTLAASVAIAADKPAVIQFSDLESKFAEYKDKVVAVHGGVDIVLPKENKLIIADHNHPCCGQGCAGSSMVVMLPKNLKAQMAKAGDQVIAIGKLELTDRGYTLNITELIVGVEAVQKFGK
ncbi:MAG: hypothetical protein CFE26_05695 [Verrucomicrobiales bacterium VVV1]|nr:MAG: hypothetical protein CFE26_05695 [Verrucomicrobiales bacterium VVV1]